MKKLLIVTLIVLLSLSGCKKTDPIVKEWYLKVVENDGIEYDPIEFVGSDLRLDLAVIIAISIVLLLAKPKNFARYLTNAHLFI